MLLLLEMIVALCILLISYSSVWCQIGMVFLKALPKGITLPQITLLATLQSNTTTLELLSYVILPLWLYSYCTSQTFYKRFDPDCCTSDRRTLRCSLRPVASFLVVLCFAYYQKDLLENIRQSNHPCLGCY